MSLCFIQPFHSKICRLIVSPLCRWRQCHKFLWFVAVFVLCVQRRSVHLIWNDDALPSQSCADSLPSTEVTPTKVSSTGKQPSRKLAPPFKIFQIGAPRTGSTFQYHLLQAIVSLKSPPGTVVNSLFIKDPSTKDKEQVQKYLVPNSTFVIKSHHFEVDKKLRKGWKPSSVSVFASSEGFPYAVYTHDQNRIQDCPICEIDSYVPIFDLTSNDVRLLRSYISDFSIIRRCCGMQMSKYEVLRLNGCQMSKYAYNVDYPKCEQYNLTEVEHHFASNPIPFTPLYTEYNWAKPGDCSRFQAMIKEGRGFNGEPVTKCTLLRNKK